MEELDLKQLINIFWNKRLHIISIVLVFAIIGAVYSFFLVTPEYKSYTSLLLSKSQEVGQDESKSSAITQTDISVNQKLVSTYSELIKSKNVLREVIKNLGIDDNEETLKKQITVSSVKDTELIQITVTSVYPEKAKAIADEIANVFTKKVAEFYNINNVHIVDEAEASIEPYNINHLRDILIFMVISFVISCIYVLIANMLDTTVKSLEDIETQIGVTVLASIPVIKEDTRKLKGGVL